MRLLIVGAGATGGYFGGRLAAAGRDVTFLVRPKRAAQLAAGLQITSPHGDVTVTPKLVQAGSLGPDYDAVLLTVKAYALEPALDDLAPAIGPSTAILPTLNGMRHVDAIRARFGAGALVGCACKVAAMLDGDGRIVQLARFQELAYGEMDGSRSARTDALHAALSGAGFEAKLTPDAQGEMWRKWVLLAAMGGITCLMDGSIGAVAAAPGGTAFARGLIAEVVAVVTAEGFPPEPAFRDSVEAMMTAEGSPQTSSMYRDMKAGQPIEADQIIGDMLTRGARHGIATPLLAAAYAKLCVYQSRA